MSTAADTLAPTAKLRWVERKVAAESAFAVDGTQRVLQQWFAENVPGYMRTHAQGEWRDVEVGVEAP